MIFMLYVYYVMTVYNFVMNKDIISFIRKISVDCVLNYICSNIYAIVVMGL
jgi:hypothetical protein